VSGHLLGTAAGKTELIAKKWYHAAATYDGKKWKLYLDGKLDGEKSESGNLISIKYLSLMLNRSFALPILNTP
jgi:hypothetical protein